MVGATQHIRPSMPVQVPLHSADGTATALDGDMHVPQNARGVILFAHGSGSSRHSPRNRLVARALNQAGLATLLLDLLTPAEESVDLETRHLRFDVGMLAQRLAAATAFVHAYPETRDLPVGYFGASTGAAAALIAAAQDPQVRAIVSRGGRPDLAGEDLLKVHAATLLIVGGNDTQVIAFNQEAFSEINTPEKRLQIVPGATHLFEEPGALEMVAKLAAEWFTRHLPAPIGARLP